MRTALNLLFLLSVAAQAGDTNTSPDSVEVIGRSPLQTFHIEQHRLKPNETMQVWIVSSKNPKERQLLYTHSRSVEVLVSDDERWLAINDHDGSNEARLLLFRMQRRLDYKQVEDLTDKAWKFVATRTGHKKKPGLDHAYVEALRWTDDHTILLCLHGHLDKRNFVDDWLCLYDVTSETFSTDLDKHNKKHTTLETEQ